MLMNSFLSPGLIWKVSSYLDCTPLVYLNPGIFQKFSTSTHHKFLFCYLESKERKT